MKKRFCWFFLVGLALFASSNMAMASLLDTVASVGTIHQATILMDTTTTEIKAWDTKTVDMDGMTITVTFSDGSTSTSYWGDYTDGNEYGAGIDDYWSMTVDLGVSTYIAAWEFTLEDSDLAVDSVTLNGITGKTIFDDDNSAVVTDGSEYGWPFGISSYYSTGDFDIYAYYTNIVQLPNASPLGDLYETLTIDFVNNDFTEGNTLGFYQDTDTVETIDPVPEPTTMLLFGAGMLGLSGTLARRRRK